MAAPHRWLKVFRTLHLYLGVFSAPALLFFAFTGALQSLDLHEAARGSDYEPPTWLASMAHMHKKQSFEVPAKRKPPNTPVVEAPARTDAKPPAPRHSPWPMKAFFVLVALSLLFSTLTGVCMGWRYTRHRRRYGVLLAAGIVVPALLMLF
ncbi:MAG: PepSY domain-containing protein [Pseudomonadota bacterium]